MIVDVAFLLVVWVPVTNLVSPPQLASDKAAQGDLCDNNNNKHNNLNIVPPSVNNNKNNNWASEWESEWSCLQGGRGGWQASAMAMEVCLTLWK